ncbi:chemotaxis histidine kinase [Legionella beliardensis]|uniref:Chemotaxis protein CheA n=1 Tax=Legionella beliardensis TaxID=91822 RepID=A0A378ICC3_9GAMM|nr:response regulator [Legionella beliardensis]STX29954.1 chemotaxis histidine kinase [Legionella beliardensis]
MDEKLQKILLETFKVQLQEIHQSLINALLSIEKINKEGALKATLKELFRYSHNIKGAAASASIPAIATIAHGLEDLFQEWREKNHFPVRDEIDACLQVSDNLLLALNQFDKGETIDTDHFLAPLKGEKESASFENAKFDDFIKIPLHRIERANAKANEFIIYRLKLMNWFKTLEFCLKEMNNSLEFKSLSLLPAIKTLNNMSAESGQFLGEFSRAIQCLQEEVKTMRMIPASMLLTPLSRTVRDISTKLNKSVEFEVYGGNIELDKAILDAVRDSLQHLIRNAIDHGIEDDRERKKANKPIPAKLRMEVSQSSGKIILKIIDDGKGINISQVKQHAIDTGLYSENELLHASDEQILDCIFASGFSLHKGVTEISGRGVGLDAVKNDLQKLKASIEVKTVERQGTCFTLTLPLTLATTRGVFFKLSEQTFMLPSLSLKALYDIKVKDLKWVNNQLTYVVNHTPVPVVSLNYLLTRAEEALDSEQDYCGLYIDYPGVDLILWVNSIVSEHECVIKPLPSPFSQLPQYIGTTLTGDSTLVLALEPHKIIEMALSEGLHKEKLYQIQESKEGSRKKVLIVDDSFTTRSLCANSLEAAGFSTMTAVDGKKAWELLQKHSFDCVITDLVMPNLDGFELTRLIKKNKKLAQIPVIIISLLNSTEDKERGLDAGANAFFAKNEFDTHSLIETMSLLL